MFCGLISRQRFPFLGVCTINTLCVCIEMIGLVNEYNYAEALFGSEAVLGKLLYMTVF